MRILVVGAGSTGGYFGGRLAQAGRDVTFLVREKRAAQLRADGLRIISPHGDVALTPNTITANDLRTPFDIVLLTVKAFALDQAMADIAPAVGPDTAILPVLNGMRHFDRIAERFGAHAVMGCLCKIVGSLDDQGRIVQATKAHDLIYGELDGRSSARLSAIDAVMQGAGFDARASTDIQRDLWEKWVYLASLGAITCLMRGPIGAVASVPGGVAFNTRLLHEIAAIAAKAGHAPGDALIENIRAQFTRPESTQTSSMYRDMQSGGAVEVEQILGDLAARARSMDLDTPLLDAALVHLRVYESGRTAA